MNAAAPDLGTHLAAFEFDRNTRSIRLTGTAGQLPGWGPELDLVHFQRQLDADSRCRLREFWRALSRRQTPTVSLRCDGETGPRWLHVVVTASEPVEGRVRKVLGIVQSTHETAMAHERELPKPRGIAGRRVLLVSPEPDARRTLAALIRQAGARCVTCSSGAEAIGAVVADQPDPIDAVLLHMPEPSLDAVAMLFQIRNVIPHAPLVLLTPALDDGLTDRLRLPPKRILMGAASDARRIVSTLAGALADVANPALGAGARIFDAHRLAARLGRRAHLLPRLIAHFCQRHATSSNQLAQALASGDGNALMRIAHSLKGMAGHLGAEELHACAGHLLDTPPRHETARRRAVQQTIVALERLLDRLATERPR
ncbi:MAG: response regulator [Rhodocyclaceae bacterium]|nr:response regulator [Rhodocyclaceae bacterium]